MARSYPSNLPTNYAAEKLPRLNERWRVSAFRDAVTEFTPRVFRDVPGPAVCGFTASATNASEVISVASFHEVGLFQTPAGPVSGPVPGQTDSSTNAWRRLATSAQVRALLGRDANIAPDGWKNNVRDQVAVGLADLDAHRRAVASVLVGLGAAEIAPGESAGPWAWFCAMLGFSRGPVQAGAVLAPFVRELAAVVPANRPAVWGTEIARAILANAADIRGRSGEGGAPYAAVRNFQKWYCGRAVASVLNDTSAVAWFAGGVLSREAEDTIARRAGGTTVPGVTLPPPPAPTTSAQTAGGLVALGTIVAGGILGGAIYAANKG